MKVLKTKDLTKEDLAKIINAQTKVEVKLEKENEEIRELLRESRAMTACHNLLCEQVCDCLNCKFWNRPEVKALLERSKV